MPSPSAANGMSPAVVVVLLTLLLGIQPVSTDLYLPALPTLQSELGASIGGAQLTLSALIVCFGVGQLVCGPLSDRFGRRPVLLWGLALYTLASAFAAASATIEALVAWRSLQGLAMAAAVTCGRSIVRDLFAPHEGARVMSRALGGLCVLAMLSPLLGGVLVQAAGWHVVMAMPALFGAVTLGLVAWKFEETVSQRNPRATEARQLWANWADVARHPTFRAWVALLSCTYGGLFLYLAASSFVYIDVLGLSRAAYGLVMATASLAYIAGTVLCRRLLVARGLRRTVRIGGAFSLVGGLASVALSLAGLHTVWAVLLPQLVFAVGHGIHQPCGQTGAIGPFPEKAGAAAALSGFVMMATSFVIGLWLGRGLNGTVYPLTLGLGFFGCAVALVAWTLVQRHGEPTAAAPLG
jgi:MFS transporter, DHA1 family, multidrug resistance protein